MCRFTLYLGPSIALASLLTEPRHSLIQQSHAARERSSPLNGDGFGVAWYAPGQAIPGLYRNVRPAWNDQNLAHLARVVESRAILAHVRAASPGLPVTQLNCHPFVHGPWAFAHNGLLGGFASVRRPLLASLSERAFHAVRGSTDSEHLFALFLDELGEADTRPSDEALLAALRRAVARALALVDEHAPGAHSFLNLCATDGERAVVCRSNSADAPYHDSLYVNTGRRYSCEDGRCRMLAAERDEGARLISSERLSDDPGWRALEGGEFLVV